LQTSAYPYPASLKEIESSTNLQYLKAGIYRINENKTYAENIRFLTPGKPSIHAASMAYQSLKSAMLKQSQLGGNMITLPLSKEWVKRAGIKDFQGHTEELAKFYNVKTFMLMYSGKLNVITLTTHIPLQAVSETLQKVDYKKLFLAIEKSGLFTKPKIGFCGLNPHAGEGGKIGREEVEFILPLIKKFQKKGWDIDGPISADSIFTKELISNYDLIFSCYHDQGLIPFKSIAGKKGVNITLGLPFIRVSPDHGTAFDIAGKGIASPESLLECFRLLL
jgi:4-hydroxythreonine-4-phosphate dehydrogenase